jgi:crotonobetainyl-CoA:carnitine CoA-transferase CaiB-like acyl-CoA transferase
LSETPGSVRSTGPALGEHNADVYGTLLGLSAESIADLTARGVI